MTSGSRTVNKRQTSLLDDGSGASTISNKFKDEQANSPSKLLKDELFLSLAIVGHIKFELTRYFALETIQINTSIEGLQSFTIVCECVELKDFDVDCGYVFDLQK